MINMQKITHSHFIDIKRPLTENARMDSKLILKGIRFSGHCGVTPEERNQPQPILVDLELDCPASQSSETDQIQDTIDYAQVIDRVVDIGTHHHVCLVETLVERISQTLCDEFPILGMEIWIRKTAPPLKERVDSVGVRLSREGNTLSQQSLSFIDEPASLLIEQQHMIPKGTILDVATGHGRNAIYLARQGYSVTGIDRDVEALHSVQQKAEKLKLPNLAFHVQDLEEGTTESLHLGEETYDGILVFFYLHRPLFPSLIRALKPGGVLIYETFLIDNHHIHQHPRRQEFCLQHNELLQLTDTLRILYYEEGFVKVAMERKSPLRPGLWPRSTHSPPDSWHALTFISIRFIQMGVIPLVRSSAWPIKPG